MKQSVNSHIEEYLDYYCGLSEAPSFAVLLKGDWGAGKTWFIDRYCERFKDKKSRCLYISLYGVTSFAEIEDAFFEQLHPLLASKGMMLAGKILKGALKTTLQIDLNSDGRNDATAGYELPEKLEFLRDIGSSILVFDDLERCNMDIGNILGYVNNFVEHQGLKVIIVANEDNLLERSSKSPDNPYKAIKEKLIGKTFEISVELSSVLEDFIQKGSDPAFKQFCTENMVVIKDLYTEAKYNNLRSLKQIVWDFERLFKCLPDKARQKRSLLVDLLKTLTALSIEIKKGTLEPKQITALREQYISKVTTQAQRNNYQRSLTFSKQKGKSSEENASLQETSDRNPLQEVLDRYEDLNLYELVPSSTWWKSFFDKGVIDIDELEQSLLSSKYFQDENTPSWIKLWHTYDLTDDEFDSLLEKVVAEYNAREIKDLGVLKHIIGLLFKFSNAGLYHESKSEILQSAKSYLDDFINSDTSRHLDPYSWSHYEGETYASLGFSGTDIEEFQMFCDYVKSVQEGLIVEDIPHVVQKLLCAMRSDAARFSWMLRLNNGVHLEGQRYYDSPILQYIPEEDFLKTLIAISHEDKRFVFYTLKKRYEIHDFNRKLVEELIWLKSIRSRLLDEVTTRREKLSGHILQVLIENYLDFAVEKLQETSDRLLQETANL